MKGKEKTEGTRQADAKMSSASVAELKKRDKEKNIAGAVAICNDPDCHIHGNLKTRGRIFEGKVIKKFYKRVVIEFERTVYIRKYERYKKSRTKIHARLPNCMKDSINVGDYIRIQECRPLSKIIHFAVIEKIRDADSGLEVKGK